MEFVAAVVMVGSTVGLFFVWRAQARDPARWQRWFAETVWIRAIGWTVAVTAAAVAGSVLGGGEDIAAMAAAIGFVVSLVLVVFWSYARTFGSRR